MTSPKITMKLFAKWSRGQDPSCDNPIEIQWEDGRVASLDEYIRHLDDTHVIRIVNDRVVRITFPGLIADVRFDREISRWVCAAHGQSSIIMELSTHDVSDDQIVAELYTYPIVYKALIHRD